MSRPRLIIACLNDPVQPPTSPLASLCNAVESQLVCPASFRSTQSVEKPWLVTGLSGDGSARAIANAAISLAAPGCFLLTRDIALARLFLASSLSSSFIFSPDPSTPLAELKGFDFDQVGGKIARVVASSAVQHLFLTERLRYPADRVELIPEGVDETFFSPADSKRDLSRIIVPWFQGLDMQTLVQSGLRREGDVEIVVPPGQSLDGAGMKVVHATPEARRDLLRKAGAVVIASSQQETSAGASSLLEAMACGAPLVVSHSRGLEHLYIPDHEVLVYTLGDSQALRTQTHQLLSDEESARNLSLHARRKVETTLTNRHYARRMARLLLPPRADQGPEFYLLPAHVRPLDEILP